MSNFECRLNCRFWRPKKVGGKGGGGEEIWTKSKRTAAFFWDVLGEDGQRDL